jgi:hypothetical protein
MSETKKNPLSLEDHAAKASKKRCQRGAPSTSLEAIPRWPDWLRDYFGVDQEVVLRKLTKNFSSGEEAKPSRRPNPSFGLPTGRPARP